MDKISTGIKGFDDIMGGLYPGDNVVWQVEDINNYKHVVDAFVRKSIKDGKNVNYIHFRKVNSIIDDLSKVNLFCYLFQLVYRLNFVLFFLGSIHLV